jgi:hypothetical protein
MALPRRQLIEKLHEIKERCADDPERGHSEADDALLEYIGDLDITQAYAAAHPGWCA